MYSSFVSQPTSRSKWVGEADKRFPLDGGRSLVAEHLVSQEVNLDLSVSQFFGLLQAGQILTIGLLCIITADVW